MLNWFKKRIRNLRARYTVFRKITDVILDVLYCQKRFSLLQELNKTLEEKIEYQDKVGEVPVCYKHINSFFRSASIIESMAERLTGDLFIANEASTLLPALQLKQKYGGKVVWFVKEHWSYQARSFTYWKFNETNEIGWQSIDDMILACCEDVDFALCTGRGYQIALEQLGVNAININRKILNKVNNLAVKNCNISEQIKALRLDGCKVLVYPGTIYESSDFLTVLKALSLLPEKYHLFHFGRFESDSLKHKVFFETNTLNLKNNVHFMGELEYSRYQTLLNLCDLGIVHLAPNIESNRLSFHNRYADMIGACLPFIYTENISIRDVDFVKKNCLEYDWRKVEDLLKVLHLQTNNASNIDSEMCNKKITYFDDSINKFISGLNCKRAVFISNMNLCNNKPSNQFSEILINSGINVKYASVAELEWKDKSDRISKIKLVNSL